jgi:hypothetical protein
MAVVAGVNLHLPPGARTGPPTRCEMANESPLDQPLTPEEAHQIGVGLCRDIATDVGAFIAEKVQPRITDAAQHGAPGPDMIRAVAKLLRDAADALDEGADKAQR